MAIENTVSIDFSSTFLDSIGVFDCRLPGVYTIQANLIPARLSYILDPQGFGGSGENGFLFSESWGALVIIFRDLGSKLIVLGI